MVQWVKNPTAVAQVTQRILIPAAMAGIQSLAQDHPYANHWYGHKIKKKIKLCIYVNKCKYVKTYGITNKSM